ncbi:xanthine dehydrogenase family protein molybdopterin-binding subunit [Psychromarinibacter sp. C21-152]|uniref:Xanthine dehydrogenase family protein molybdopterin-binding subunit n=1 Tax=Psychromarinibacter sediminicola TaxID=3033385 RepID=A0AAE3T821_9RHOB|nr:xanthine dehydrogenase family protein molybdopterin-binding subunit [Psychromarinibacter sediminicola]MDF0600308.1 xanthine dehydrogenase family protein molybdopterin-binding subunit [Psychromarinibacter sediminicola]
MKFGIGQSVARKEDARFLTGRARYVADIERPRMLHAVVLRAPVAHGRLNGIETEAAKAAPGVAAVLTGADCAADGIGGLSCHTLFPGMHQVKSAPPMPALATDRLTHVGAPVALILADSLAAARDAAELVELDYEELDPVLTPAAAMAEGAPVLHAGAEDNLAFTVALGDAGATEAALAAAAHVTRLELHNNRLSANAIEMRATLAEWDRRDGRLTVHTSTQNPHSVKSDVAGALGLPETQVRVLAPDVGGGFGMKGAVYPEDVLVAWAAKRLERPVLWQADRAESLLSDYHGRDQTVTAELGFDGDGRIAALRVTMDYNQGAHLASGGGVAAMFASTLATGCYDIPVAHTYARGVYTNTAPTQPYRGAGRPEASYLIERLMDKAAAELGEDRVALRRKNLISAGAMPYKTPLLYTIDGGDYAAVLDRALAAADWDGAAARKAAAETKGRRRGIGLAVHMENAGLANEGAEIRFDPSGGVTVLAGTFSHGQGHETVYAQMVSDWLGVPFETVRVVQGDTDAVSFGRGTVASRSMINGGGAIRGAADEVIEKGKAMAAHLMEVSPADVEFAEGTFSVAGTDKAMPIRQIAALSFKPIFPPELGMGLHGQHDFLLQGFAFPNGCQICEVEVDPETGVVELVQLTSVDDVGTVVNPMLLEGQIVGGIAQGMGQALMEDVAYDGETGQLLSGSFMDYAMPRAGDVPPVRFEVLSTDTQSNPLGAKGAGEAGTVGATPVVMSAVLDALAPLGVRELALPASPQRVWAAIRAAEG